MFTGGIGGVAAGGANDQEAGPSGENQKEEEELTTRPMEIVPTRPKVRQRSCVFPI